MFSKSMLREKQISKFDVLIILILLQKRERNVRFIKFKSKAIFNIFQKLFQRGILTIDLLIETIQNKFICENVTNSIYSICVYMLHHSDSFKKEKKKHLSVIHLFFIEAFKNYESIRPKVLS
jgi:hypothetical protein